MDKYEQLRIDDDGNAWLFVFRRAGRAPHTVNVGLRINARARPYHSLGSMDTLSGGASVRQRGVPSGYRRRRSTARERGDTNEPYQLDRRVTFGPRGGDADFERLCNDWLDAYGEGAGLPAMDVAKFGRVRVHPLGHRLNPDATLHISQSVTHPVREFFSAEEDEEYGFFFRAERSAEAAGAAVFIVRDAETGAEIHSTAGQRAFLKDSRLPFVRCYFVVAPFMFPDADHYWIEIRNYTPSTA